LIPLSISYRYITNFHRVSLPATLELRDEDGSLPRHRRSRYDEYGQRSFIVFGNGVRSDYSYIPTVAGWKDWRLRTSMDGACRI